MSDPLLTFKSTSIPAVQVTDTPFLPGEVIGDRYVVERVLAEGGVGVVVAAKHLELEETVAIKFLKPEFARSPDIIGRFAREAKAAAKIKSEHSVRVIDVGVTIERGPYIVMEYLDGHDLEMVIEKTGRASVERAVEILLQMCDALAEAHSYGIVHRDIKPANIFLVKRDHDMPSIKILDFGISKATLAGNVFGGAISMVKTQSLLGSPLYMSPEQLRGDPDAGVASDIWSVGTVLYELLTGQCPFNGSTIPEVCASVLERNPPRIASFAVVPPALEAIVEKCMSKDAAARYGSVAELAIALAPFGPKRARMCVERAVAVSKASGIVPAHVRTPDSVAPPPMSTPPSVGSFGPPAPFVSGSTLPPPHSERAEAELSNARNLGRPSNAMWLGLGMGIPLILVGGALVLWRELSAKPAVSVSSERPVPAKVAEPAIVVQSAPHPSVEPQPSVTLRATPSTNTKIEAPSPPLPVTAKQSPVHASPVVTPTTTGGKASRGVSATLTAFPPATALPPPSPLPQTTQPSTKPNPTRSAIDDRK